MESAAACSKAQRMAAKKKPRPARTRPGSRAGSPEEVTREMISSRPVAEVVVVVRAGGGEREGGLEGAGAAWRRCAKPLGAHRAS